MAIFWGSCEVTIINSNLEDVGKWELLVNEGNSSTTLTPTPYFYDVFVQGKSLVSYFSNQDILCIIIHYEVEIQQYNIF